MEIKNVSVIDINTEGLGIGRSEDFTKVLFIKNAINGDVVDVRITKEEKNYAICEVTSYVKKSSFSVAPKCEHYGLCGGCNMQHLSYELQLQNKQKRVQDALSKIAKIDVKVKNIIPSPKEFYYRNKMDFQFSNFCWITNEEEDKDRRALGLHIKERFDRVLNINNCHLHLPEINEIRNFIKDFCLKANAPFYNPKYKSGVMRNLIFKTNSKGEIMVIIIFACPPKVFQANLCMALKSAFPLIKSIYWGVNKKEDDDISGLKLLAFKGEDYYTEELNETKFKIGIQSFFQVNTEVASVMVKKILEIEEFKKEHTVYDLYCGVGTFALNIAKHAGKVIGIEIAGKAIENARESAILNNITNAKFITGDAGEAFNADFVLENGQADFVVLDPPRIGLSKKLISNMLEALPKKIIYISCNPASLARDIADLKEKYEVKEVIPFDMFPQTTHVEVLCVLHQI